MYIKKACFFFILFFSFFVIGCASVGKPLILGSEKQTIDNIFVEYLNIGDTYLSLEKYDKAIEYYTKAMKSKELYWSCYYKIGKVYALKSQWEEAVVYYEKLLKRDPQNSTLKASLAYIKASNNELDKAKNIYEELILIHPENQLFLENYISILFTLEKNHKDKIIAKSEKKSKSKQKKSDKLKKDLQIVKDNTEETNIEVDEKIEVFEGNYKKDIKQYLSLLKELFPQSDNINKFQKQYESIYNEKETVQEEDSKLTEGDEPTVSSEES